MANQVPVITAFTVLNPGLEAERRPTTAGGSPRRPTAPCSAGASDDDLSGHPLQRSNVVPATDGPGTLATAGIGRGDLTEGTQPRLNVLDGSGLSALTRFIGIDRTGPDIGPSRWGAAAAGRDNDITLRAQNHG